MYLNNKNKLEKLNTLNQTLIQVQNCKEIAKWLIKTLLSSLKQDETKLAKYFLSIGLDETKSSILKELVK